MLSFHVQFVQTDRHADNSKTICPPIYRCGGIKSEGKGEYNNVFYLVMDKFHCLGLI